MKSMIFPQRDVYSGIVPDGIDDLVTDGAGLTGAEKKPPFSE